VDVMLLYFDGCPNWQVTDARLRQLQEEVGFSLGSTRVETREEAERLGFVGSPTMLIDGRDAFPHGGGTPGLACRMYQTPEGLRGSPTLEQLREAMVVAPPRPSSSSRSVP
jgi:hypothetical protein